MASAPRLWVCLAGLVFAATTVGVAVQGCTEWQARDDPRSARAVEQYFERALPEGSTKEQVIDYLDASGRSHTASLAGPSDPAVRDGAVPLNSMVVTTFVHSTGTLLQSDAQFLAYFVFDDRSRLVKIVAMEHVFVGS